MMRRYSSSEDFASEHASMQHPTGDPSGSQQHTTATFSSRLGSFRPESPTGTPQRLQGGDSARRVHKTTACDECRRRRARCGPGIPCQQCIRRNITCRFTTREDGRTREAKKRVLEESQESTKKALSDVLEILRASDSSDYESFMQLVNHGASVDEVMQYLEDRGLDEDTGSVISQAFTNPDQQVNLLDQREKHGFTPSTRNYQYSPIPISVPAEPWTTVTSDRRLVSILISLFMTWLQPHFWVFIDPEDFLRDMANGNIGSTSCSPFLCNAILSEACTHYDGSDKRQLQGQFLEEAQQKWQEESQNRLRRPSLTYAQGLMCLSIRRQLMGFDRQGWELLTKAVDVLKELQTQVKMKPLDGPSFSDKLISRNLVRISWAAYILHVRTALALAKPVHDKPPTRTAPGFEETTCNNVSEWSPYPLSKQTLDVHKLCCFRAECQLALIIQGMTNLLHGSRESTEEKLSGLATTIHTRLKLWYQDLPHCMSIQNSTWVYPICLHAMYNWLRILLFEFLRKEDIALQTQDQMVDGVAKQPASSPSPSAEIEIASARRISDLNQLYCQLYGYSHYQVFMMQPTAAALFCLLPYLDSSQNRDAFSNLCASAREYARLWPLGARLLRMVERSAEETNIDIPPEASRHLQEFDEKIWPASRRQSLFRQYSNALLVDGDVGDTEMNGI